MNVIEPAAQAAILNGGTAGWIADAGGSLRVALFLAGVEVTGNGYARKSIATAELAATEDGETAVDLAAVTFTASGGDIEYDQVKVYDLAGTALQARSAAGATVTIEPGSPLVMTLQLRIPGPLAQFYDATQWNQLTDVAGPPPARVYFAPNIAPYLTAPDTVYTEPLWLDALRRRGHIMLDWEPNVVSFYGTGTIESVNGAVELTGGSFPNYSPNALYKLRLYVGGTGDLGARVGATLKLVTTRTDATHLVLEDLTFNCPPGTVYKFTTWEFREIDPKFATSDAEWQGALDEIAYCYDKYYSAAVDAGAIMGWYDMLVPIHARYLDIIGDAPTYAEWQTQVAALLNYTTAQGWSFRERLIADGAVIWFNSYISTAMNTTPAAWDNFQLRTQRISETCAAQGVNAVPLFLRHTIEGFGTWAGGGTGEEVNRTLLEEQVRDAVTRGSYAFWGGASGTLGLECRLSDSDDFVEWLGDLNEELAVAE